MLFDLPPWTLPRRNRLEERLVQLLAAPAVPGTKLFSVTEAAGVYAFREHGSKVGQYLRVGRSDSSLRQRIYQNHLMGTQKGNLRAQLVRYGRCFSLDDAKEWIQKNCSVQVLVIADASERRWCEHYILSVLQPDFSD